MKGKVCKPFASIAPALVGWFTPSPASPARWKRRNCGKSIPKVISFGFAEPSGRGHRNVPFPVGLKIRAYPGYIYAIRKRCGMPDPYARWAWCNGHWLHCVFNARFLAIKTCNAARRRLGTEPRHRWVWQTLNA